MYAKSVAGLVKSYPSPKVLPIQIQMIILSVYYKHDLSNKYFKISYKVPIQSANGALKIYIKPLRYLKLNTTLIICLPDTSSPSKRETSFYKNSIKVAPTSREDIVIDFE